MKFLHTHENHKNPDGCFLYVLKNNSQEMPSHLLLCFLHRNVMSCHSLVAVDFFFAPKSCSIVANVMEFFFFYFKLYILFNNVFLMNFFSSISSLVFRAGKKEIARCQKKNQHNKTVLNDRPRTSLCCKKIYIKDFN